MAVNVRVHVTVNGKLAEAAAAQVKRKKRSRLVEAAAAAPPGPSPPTNKPTERGKPAPIVGRKKETVLVPAQPKRQRWERVPTYGGKKII